MSIVTRDTDIDELLNADLDASLDKNDAIVGYVEDMRDVLIGLVRDIHTLSTCEESKIDDAEDKAQDKIVALLHGLSSIKRLASGPTPGVQ